MLRGTQRLLRSSICSPLSTSVPESTPKLTSPRLRVFSSKQRDILSSSNPIPASVRNSTRGVSTLTPGASKADTLQAEDILASALYKDVTSATMAVGSARKKVTSADKVLTATIKEAAKLKVGTVEHHEATLAVLAAKVDLTQANVHLTRAKVDLAQALVASALNEAPYDCKKVSVAEKNLAYEMMNVAYEKMKLAEAERNLLEAELVVAMAKVPADAAYIERLNRNLTHASSVVDSARKEYDGFADAFATVPASTLDSPVASIAKPQINMGALPVRIPSADSMPEYCQAFMSKYRDHLLASTDNNGRNHIHSDVDTSKIPTFHDFSTFARLLYGSDIRLADAVTWSATDAPASATEAERATASTHSEFFKKAIAEAMMSIAPSDTKTATSNTSTPSNTDTPSNTSTATSNTNADKAPSKNAAFALMQLISKLFLRDENAVVTVDLKKLFPQAVGRFFGNGDSSLLYFRFDKSTIGHVAAAQSKGSGAEDDKYPLIDGLFDMEQLGELPVGVLGRLIIFGCPGIGKSFALNLFAIMHIAAKVPFATYREADKLFSIFNGDGSSMAFDVAPGDLDTISRSIAGRGITLLIDPAQGSKADYDFQNHDGCIVTASSSRPSLVFPNKRESVTSYWVMRVPTENQLMHIVRQELPSIMPVHHKMFAEIIEQVPFLPVTGASIRLALHICSKVAESVKSKDTNLRQIICDSYQKLLTRIILANLENTHIIDPVFLTNWINALKSGDAHGSSLDDESNAPSSRLMVEFPFFDEVATETPSMQWTPASLLGMMTMAWLSAERSTDSLMDLMCRIKDFSRSTMGFVFERFVALSVDAAVRADVATQHIADFSKNLRSTEDKAKLKAERAAVPEDWRPWKLVPLNGSGRTISITPNELVVVEGTTTCERTYVAIAQQVQDFNSRVGAGNKTDRCVYVAFAYDRTPDVDGCVIYRPSSLTTYLIPMQLTIAQNKTVTGAKAWVEGLAGMLPKSGPEPTKVAAFCVVRPSIGGLFATDKSTVVSSNDLVMPECPIVVYDFDSQYVAAGLRSALFAIDSAFRLMINKVRENKKPVMKLPNCYPQIKDDDK